MTLAFGFLAGLVLLVVGAELLVRGASRLALGLGVSPLVVGLTVVSFGTSAPEVAVSVGSVLEGRTDIAIGNVVGSNIFNVLFILGVTALIAPLIVNVQLIRQEVPIMIAASALLLSLAMDGVVGMFDGALLVGLLVVYTAFLIVQSRSEPKAVQDAFALSIDGPSRSSRDARLPMQLLMIGGGLVCLVLGADLFVDASVTLATRLGVSDIVVGLTIVAAGTSLPEVATSIMAAIRGERDIAVGNVVGSNTFNILGCLGLSALAAGDSALVVAPSLMHFDIWVMIAAAVACLPMFITGCQIARWEGAVFVLYYAAYAGYLILAAQQHDAIDAFSVVMASFVLPLTIVTLVVGFVRREAS